MPATVQPVLVTPSLPLLLAFYKALLGAAEISRMPEDGPVFYVGLQIGNAELGIVTDGEADIAAPQLPPLDELEPPGWCRWPLTPGSFGAGGRAPGRPIGPIARSG